VIDLHEVPKPRLPLDEMAVQVDDRQVDVAGDSDSGRAIFDHSGPSYTTGAASRFTSLTSADGERSGSRSRQASRAVNLELSVRTLPTGVYSLKLNLAAMGPHLR
jgi:hypothetical protein